MDQIASPPIRIKPLGVARRDGALWRTIWGLTNTAQEPIHVRDATAPHSQFRGHAALALDVPVRGSTEFPLLVRVVGAVGAEIENAFLILVVDLGDARWRVLARLGVRVEDGGRPRPRVETVTVQRVGFSGEL